LVGLGSGVANCGVASCAETGPLILRKSMISATRSRPPQSATRLRIVSLPRIIKRVRTWIKLGISLWGCCGLRIIWGRWKIHRWEFHRRRRDGILKAEPPAESGIRIRHVHACYALYRAWNQLTLPNLLPYFNVGFRTISFLNPLPELEAKIIAVYRI